MAADRRAGNRVNPTIRILGMGETPCALRELLSPDAEERSIGSRVHPGQADLAGARSLLRSCPLRLPRWREPQIGYEQSEGDVGTMADTDLGDGPIRSAAAYAAVTVAFRVG